MSNQGFSLPINKPGQEPGLPFPLINQAVSPPTSFGGPANEDVSTPYVDQSQHEEVLPDHGDAVYWQVEGWDENNPFQGYIVFTDEYGNLLTSIPVEPEAMRSLNEITGAILAEQVAKITGRPVEYPTMELDGKGNKNRKIVTARPLGIPISLNVNPKALIAAGVVLAALLLFVLVGSLIP